MTLKARVYAKVDGVLRIAEVTEVDTYAQAIDAVKKEFKTERALALVAGVAVSEVVKVLA